MPYITAPDGTRLFYQDEGEGTPILCLAGLTRTHRDFQYALPALAGYRVIRMDYRGRGASDWADHTSYTIAQEAQDVLQLLDHLHLSQVGLLGTSRGGLIAMGLGLAARDRLTGVCLNDIGPEIDPAGLSIITDYVGRNPRFATHAEMAAAMPDLMQGFANVSAQRWLNEVQTLYHQTERGLQITYDPLLRHALRINSGPVDLWPFFDALGGMPLALIRGAHSNILSRDTVAKMLRQHPEMLFAEIPDRAHIPFLDELEAVFVIQTWAAML